jgi:hypothetical protein
LTARNSEAWSVKLGQRQNTGPNRDPEIEEADRALPDRTNSIDIWSTVVNGPQSTYI